MSGTNPSYLVNINGEQTTQSNIADPASLQIQSIQQSLADMYSNYGNAITSSATILDKQNSVKDIVLQESNRIDSEKNNLDQILQTNTRNNDLKENARKRQNAYNYMLFIAVIILSICLVLSFIRKTIPIIPEALFSFLYVIILSVGTIYISYLYYDISTRDMLNFDELHFSYSPVVNNKNDLIKASDAENKKADPDIFKCNGKVYNKYFSNIRRNTILNTCDALLSPNRRYLFAIQDDSNLVIYDTTNSNPIWNSGTSIDTDSNNPPQLRFQDDDNLVLYGYNTTSNKYDKPLWKTDTAHTTGTSTRLTMQDDGYLVIYNGNDVVWSSRDSTGSKVLGGVIGNKFKCNGKNVNVINTSPKIVPGTTLNKCDALLSSNGKYIFIVQDDNNLVIYNTENSNAIWSSGTNSTGPIELIYQTDFNLVLYSNGTAKWLTNTNWKKSTRLIMQDDGNLVIYNGNDVIWSSRNSTGAKLEGFGGMNSYQKVEPFSPSEFADYHKYNK